MAPELMREQIMQPYREAKAAAGLT